MEQYSKINYIMSNLPYHIKEEEVTLYLKIEERYKISNLMKSLLSIYEEETEYLKVQNKIRKILAEHFLELENEKLQCINN